MVSPASGVPPLSGAEFFDLVDGLGPYETAPHVAVAVSGGPDSLSLALLLAEWVRDRGGRLEAATVDHGLRPGSAVEAAAVGRSLGTRGIRHHVLTWPGQRPRTGIQEAAREARYALLLDWCSRAGILHLFVAHHLEDRAETFLMRVARGSGRSGLASMSRVVERRGVRLLRPCLGTERDRLRASLDAFGIEAVHDPSNDDPRFTRARVRARLPVLANAGLAPGRLASAASDASMHRNARERQIARGLAFTASLHPAGYARIRLDAFRSLPADLQPAVLDAILSVIGGHARPLRRKRIERLSAAIRHSGEVGGEPFRGATLGGCIVVPHRGYLLVCREPSAAAERIVVLAPGRFMWDGRFEIELGPSRDAGRLTAGSIARLGEDGWKEIVSREPALRDTTLPWPVRAGLPAVRDVGGVLEAPHLGYRRPAAGLDTVRVTGLAFRPARALAGPGFMVA